MFDVHKTRIMTYFPLYTDKWLHALWDTVNIRYYYYGILQFLVIFSF